MAWEERVRGGRYYVRKRWQAGRCVSEYIGTGAYAALLARVDEHGRRQHAAARQARREERQRERDIDAGLDAVMDVAATLTTAVLLVAGYHTHRRQWRRQRERHG